MGSAPLSIPSGAGSAASPARTEASRLSPPQCLDQRQARLGRAGGQKGRVIGMAARPNDGGEFGMRGQRP